jgi:hypothetical protein
VRAGRRLGGAKHAEYRNGDDYFACTDDDYDASTGNSSCRHTTDDGYNASTGNGACRHTADGDYNASTHDSARRHPTCDDHGRARDPDEEKEGCENNPAAGDRKVDRQRYGTRALSQIGAKRVPALYSVRKIAGLANGARSLRIDEAIEQRCCLLRCANPSPVLLRGAGRL